MFVSEQKTAGEKKDFVGSYPERRDHIMGSYSEEGDYHIVDHLSEED